MKYDSFCRRTVTILTVTRRSCGGCEVRSTPPGKVGFGSEYLPEFRIRGLPRLACVCQANCHAVLLGSSESSRRCQPQPPSVASCRAWPAQELPPRRYPVTAYCSRSRYSAQDSHNLRLIRTEESIPTSARATVTRLLELAQLPVPSAHRLARRKAICSPDLTRGRRSASTRLDVSCPLLTTFTEKYSRRTSLAVHRIESTTMLGSRSPPSPI